MGACWSGLWGRRHATDPERELELSHITMREEAADDLMEMHMLKAEIRKLEAKLSLFTKQIGLLRLDLKASKREIANLKVDLEESETANLRLQQEVMEKQKQKDECEDRCVIFLDANIQLKCDLADYSRIVAELEEQIEALQAKLPLK